MVLAAFGTAVLAGACSAGALSSTPTVHAGLGKSKSSGAASSPAPAVVAVTTPAQVTPPPPHMLPDGKQGGRSDVPWSLVGPGWLLATWRTAPPSVAISSPSDTLFLVDPEGGRYDLGTSPAELTDWSGDGERALFTMQSPADLSETVVVQDLRTGDRDTFSVAGGYGKVAFTNPSGRAVLVAGGNSTSGTIPVRRYSLRGDLELSYPDGPLNPGRPSGAFAESPNGMQLVLANTTGLELVGNDGQVVRTLSTPPSEYGCADVGWWGAASVLAYCDGRPWVVPTNGAAPAPLTATQQDTIGAWLLPSGPVVEDAACGVTWLERVNATGATQPLEVPGTPEGGSVGGVGVYGDELAITMTPGCDMGVSTTKTSSADWYNPTTDVVTPVLGAGVNGGWVDNAVSWK